MFSTAVIGQKANRPPTEAAHSSALAYVATSICGALLVIFIVLDIPTFKASLSFVRVSLQTFKSHETRTNIWWKSKLLFE